MEFRAQQFEQRFANDGVIRETYNGVIYMAIETPFKFPFTQIHTPGAPRLAIFAFQVLDDKNRSEKTKNKPKTRKNHGPQKHERDGHKRRPIDRETTTTTQETSTQNSKSNTTATQSTKRTREKRERKGKRTSEGEE